MVPSNVLLRSSGERVTFANRDRQKAEAPATVNAVAFDTLKFARMLRERASMSPEQAEGMADAMAEVFAGSIPSKTDIAEVRRDIEALRLSTKTEIAEVRHDIEALRLSTKADINALRLSTKADIATSKSDIIKWMIGMIGFQTAAILGGGLALVRSLH